jgi:hypothetical protein
MKTDIWYKSYQKIDKTKVYKSCYQIVIILIFLNVQIVTISQGIDGVYFKYIKKRRISNKGF